MAFIFFNIFVAALIATSIAPLMPIFQEKFGISIFLSSFIPVLNTIGSITFSFVSSFLINKIGIKRLNIISYGFVFFSLISLAFFKSLEMSLFSFFLLGAGNSILFTTSTTLLTHLENPKFGFLHGFFGLGGILSPIIISMLLSFNISYRFLYILYSLLVILLFIWNFLKEIPFLQKETTVTKTIFKPIFLISILSFLVYAGSEISTVTWASNLFLSFGYSKEKASLFLGVFWFLFTLSRFMMEFFLKLFNERKLISLFSVFSALFLLFTLLFKMYFFFFLFGFSMGCIFPLIQRRANMSLQKEEVGFLNGVTYATTGIGSLLFVSLMGYISNYSISSMFVLPVFGLLVVAIIQLKG
ncbi:MULTISPECIES: MFS transporter [unclassified Thermosipho (in: thermotogales)]|uniref:MFS transporter n=1 Tax=unclassified Thermosipho (in: thermotogales) TaxID=2676525 RepID=UPI000985C177|nr:MFS transporter [Thermosipho sp. 1223]MBT1247674.1 MFS transporter [Thermosipho sp. 1244]OOC46743.1 MFS transporter [Thermosipho sp. 1223]